MKVFILDERGDVALLEELCRRAGLEACGRLDEADVLFLGHRREVPRDWAGPVVAVGCRCHPAPGVSLDKETCTPQDVAEVVAFAMSAQRLAA